MKLQSLIALLLIASYADNTPARGLKDSDLQMQGQVSYVSDGDTLWLSGPDGKRHRVRFEGIDAPEICQAWGKESRAALQAKVRGQTVTVYAGRRDDYGRWLGKVSINEADLGAWMVENGHAWSYRYRWSGGPYAGQEQSALNARRGLFALPSPERPGAFRKRNGPCPMPPPKKPVASK